MKRYRGRKVLGGNKLSTWENVPGEEEMLELVRLSREVGK